MNKNKDNKQRISFSTPNKTKEVYVLTNFDEAFSGKSIHTYVVDDEESYVRTKMKEIAVKPKNEGEHITYMPDPTFSSPIEFNTINKTFIVEYEGANRGNEDLKTRRSETNAVLYENPMPKGANFFREFFDKVLKERNDEVASYLPIEGFYLYSLIRLNGCYNLNSEQFSNESLQNKAKIMQSVLKYIKDTSLHTARLKLLKRNPKKEIYETRYCSYQFDMNDFYYSPLTLNAYPVYFDNISFNEKPTESELKVFVNEAVKYLSGPYKTVNEEKMVLKLRQFKNDIPTGLIVQSDNKGYFDKVDKLLNRLASFDNSYTYTLNKEYVHRPESDKYNPILNALFGSIDILIKEETYNKICTVETLINEVYHCHNSKKLDSYVKEAEEVLESFGDTFISYVTYRKHSLNVEYAKRLIENNDYINGYQRAKSAYECIANLNLYSKDKECLAYYHACKAEAAWVYSLATLKAGYKVDPSLVNVKEEALLSNSYYYESFDERPTLNNARKLITSYRNTGVLLEDVHSDSLKENYADIKKLYVSAYELMNDERYSPKLDNIKIYHCLISLNLKYIKSSIDNCVNIDPVENTDELIGLFNQTSNKKILFDLLNENNGYLNRMEDNEYDKNKSFGLLKLINSFYLCLFELNNDNLTNLRSDTYRYKYFVNEKEFGRLSIIKHLDTLINQ